MAYKKSFLPSHSGGIIMRDRLASTQRMNARPLLAGRSILILIWLAVIIRSALALAV